MGAYGAETYGERIAGVYDTWYGGIDEAMIDCLAALAGSGPALELGIGTGRVALPLIQRGVEVHGLDASPAMVDRLRTKEGGDRVRITLGDFESFELESRFRLIYVVFNTFFALLSQEAQVECFSRVARHLQEDGLFVIEAFVPDLNRFTHNQAAIASRVEEDVMLDLSRHDPVTQRVTSQHVRLGEDGIRLYPVRIRYAWPSELDLMARLAGLEPRERWGGWRKEPFSATSTQHVSVYGRTSPVKRQRQE
jgi:SAM-dependent methyltransferase